MTKATDYAPSPISAPKDYGVGRLCSQGEACRTKRQTGHIGKLMRYRTKVNSDHAGPQGPLLCGMCAQHYHDKQLDLAIEEQRAKEERQPIFPLPGLLRCRKASGLSQKELAKSAGVRSQYISEIERGVRHANSRLAHNLAWKLGADIRDLMWLMRPNES